MKSNEILPHRLARLFKTMIWMNDNYNYKCDVTSKIGPQKHIALALNHTSWKRTAIHFKLEKNTHQNTDVSSSNTSIQRSSESSESESQWNDHDCKQMSNYDIAAQCAKYRSCLSLENIHIYQWNKKRDVRTSEESRVHALFILMLFLWSETNKKKTTSAKKIRNKWSRFCKVLLLLGINQWRDRLKDVKWCNRSCICDLW